MNVELKGCFIQVLPLIPQIVHMFGQVAASEDESVEVKAIIGKAMAQLWSQYGPQLQAVLDNMPSDIRNALATIMPN